MENYTLDDFLADESFQNYALKRNQKDFDFWEAWLKKNTDSKNIAEQASELIRHLTFQENKTSIDIIEEEWSDLISIIEDKKAKRIRLKMREIYTTWQKIAALLIFPLFILSGIYISKVIIQDNVQYSEIITQKGSRNKIILPDSSIVILNSGSTLKYSNDYNKKERELILTGEGYFDVAENPNKSFQVLFNGNKVTALGTEFTIRDFKNEDYSQVIMIEGEVTFESSGNLKKTFLSKGDKLRYLEESKNILISKCDIEIETAWINNVLIINNDSFESLIRKLENWYGVNINIERNASYINSRYKMTLKTETLKETLELINYLTPMHYDINGAEVTITIK